MVAGILATAFFFGKAPAEVKEIAELPKTKLYQSKDYNFSFEYPADLNLAEFYDEAGDTTVFQNSSAGSLKEGKEKIGFQMFITSYGGGVITRETILKDLPSTVIEDPKEVIIGDDTRALIFWSESPKIGKTRELWFTKDGYLYEISTYANLDSWLANIMKTWKFN